MSASGGSSSRRASSSKESRRERRRKRIERKYEIPGLKDSGSTLGSLNMEFLEEPWKDPARFEYDITILERDMLALCSAKNTGGCKYSWRPGMPRSSYSKYKSVQHQRQLEQRPKTVDCANYQQAPEVVDADESIMTRTESDCILYLAGLGGKPPDSFLIPSVDTKEAETAVSPVHLETDSNGNEIVNIQGQLSNSNGQSLPTTSRDDSSMEPNGEDSARNCCDESQGTSTTDTDSSIVETQGTEEDTPTGGVLNAWFQKLIQPFKTASGTRALGENERIPTSEMRFVWTKRFDGVWVPQQEFTMCNSTADSSMCSSTRGSVSAVHQPAEEPAVQQQSDVSSYQEPQQQQQQPPPPPEYVYAEGTVQLDLNNPHLFPPLTPTTMDSFGPGSHTPSAPQSMDENLLPPDNVDYVIASTSHRHMLHTTGSPTHFDVSPTPSQMWTALTKQYTGRNAYERPPLRDLLARSRSTLNRKTMSRFFIDPEKSAQLLEYICGAPSASTARRTDSALQVGPVGPVDFVDSCLRIDPQRQIQSSMRVDFTHFV